MRLVALVLAACGIAGAATITSNPVVVHGTIEEANDPATGPGSTVSAFQILLSGPGLQFNAIGGGRNPNVGAFAIQYPIPTATVSGFGLTGTLKYGPLAPGGISGFASSFEYNLISQRDPSGLFTGEIRPTAGTDLIIIPVTGYVSTFYTLVNAPLLTPNLPGFRSAFTETPEPGTLALLVSALAGLWCIRKRRIALLALAAVACIPYVGAATITTNPVAVSGYARADSYLGGFGNQVNVGDLYLFLTGTGLYVSADNGGYGYSAIDRILTGPIRDSNYPYGSISVRYDYLDIGLPYSQIPDSNTFFYTLNVSSTGVLSGNIRIATTSDLIIIPVSAVSTFSDTSTPRAFGGPIRTITYTFTAVPEPGTLALIVSALAGLWCIRNRHSALLAILAVACVPYAGAATITTEPVLVHGTIEYAVPPQKRTMLLIFIWV